MKEISYEEFAQPWQKDKKNDFVLPLSRNSMYFFKHFPKNWNLVYFQNPNPKSKKMIPMILPHLTTHYLTAGVNGCQYRSDGKIDYILVKARLEENGWTVIDPDTDNYLKLFNAIGGKYHSDRFTEVIRLGNRIKLDFDVEKFDLWRLKLMQEGRINLPHRLILQNLLNDYEAQIERKIQKQHIPEQKQKLEKIKMEKEDIKKAIDNIIKNGVEAYKI